MWEHLRASTMWEHLRAKLSGHFWTVIPHAVASLDVRRGPAWRPWSTTVPDPVLGPIPLTGKLSGPHDAKRLLLAIHGLGGSADSAYVRRLARATARTDFACLRVNLRGADGLGHDFYHAGLHRDLGAILADDTLADFQQIVMLGFSLGGHVALSYACARPDPRLAAVAAVCSPLDLAATARELDSSRATPYRRHVMHGLKEMYRAIARHRRVDVPLEQALAIDSIVEWDDRIVAHRHGFRSAHHYYDQVSVGPTLTALRVPALYLGARNDPMVPSETVAPWLEGAPPELEVRWAERGGHVGFPAGLDLGVDDAPGLDAQVLGWLARARSLTNPRSHSPR